jgi:hypothetical protein
MFFMRPAMFIGPDRVGVGKAGLGARALGSNGGRFLCV